MTLHLEVSHLHLTHNSNFKVYLGIGHLALMCTFLIKKPIPLVHSTHSICMGQWHVQFASILHVLVLLFGLWKLIKYNLSLSLPIYLSIYLENSITQWKFVKAYIWVVPLFMVPLHAKKNLKMKLFDAPMHNLPSPYPLFHARWTLGSQWALWRVD